MSVNPFRRIPVVINPASGKDEPVLNVINEVFHQHPDIHWSVSVTQKYGDATQQARQAAESGVDLVAGYGGDGTQHEIANGIMGTPVVLGVLPGGTGNGFATELGTPKELRPAVELLCGGGQVRNVDIVKMGDIYFIQRLYVGIEPEEQTSRADKDRYGTFAYAINAYHRAHDSPIYRTFLNEGMRAGIPNKATHARTITLYLDKSAFRKALDIDNEQNMWLYLFDRSGKVLWRTAGRFSPQKGTALKDAADSFLK